MYKTHPGNNYHFLEELLLQINVSHNFLERTIPCLFFFVLVSYRVSYWQTDRIHLKIFANVRILTTDLWWQKRLLVFSRHISVPFSLFFRIVVIDVKQQKKETGQKKFNFWRQQQNIAFFASVQFFDFCFAHLWKREKEFWRMKKWEMACVCVCEWVWLCVSVCVYG